jgi:GDPmannose 4,6-dehydratase
MNANDQIPRAGRKRIGFKINALRGDRDTRLCRPSLSKLKGDFRHICDTNLQTAKRQPDRIPARSTGEVDYRLRVREIDPDRLRPIDADLQVPNTAKFHAHTGWKPEIPHEKTLRDLLDYWRTRVATEGDRFLTR